MFQRFHEKKDESGFTLIELLVVILIVAILAAVAIPVFLRQREKGYRDQMQSSLKNAATAQESYATANNGAYTSSMPDLESEGFNQTADVTVTLGLAAAEATGYCMEATHTGLPGETWRYDSAEGEPIEGDCPGS